MADTERLKSMLDNIVNDNTEEAQTDFSVYLKDKVRDHFGTNSEDTNDQANTEE